MTRFPALAFRRRPPRSPHPAVFSGRGRSISLISKRQTPEEPRRHAQFAGKREQSVSIDVPELADLEQVRGRWRTAVAGVLSKSSRKDPEQLGDEPERLLETPTYDGIAIRALYTALDHLPESALPGEWPYVRGGDAVRDVNAGWKVAEVFPAPGCADGNAAVLAALADGVSALLVRV